ncbi:MAG: proline iminopeptidase-family hydrolase [Gemmatimonadaceae bacterium]|nr:proline iminopeptidase-family hydrolase [Gemmatimonadaceae bacterium]
MRLSARLLMAALLVGCATGTPAARPTEGFIQVEGGKVWYHIEGADKPGTPLLLLHGGPGSTSFGLKPLEALASDRPVIRYDQLGCGKSDHPTDTTLFTVARFVRELQTVRDSLGLAEVDLMGHSWGAMLAEAYMGTNPKGVRRLILSSPLVTTAQWTHDADSLIKLLPDSVQQVIAKEEAAKTTDSPAYSAAMDVYYARHVRRAPRANPADGDSSSKMSGKLVYNYMWGPSEFTSTGTLKTFDATPWLKGITIPTLFLAGEFDEATPASTEHFSTLVPGARFVMIPNAGHATANDNLPALLEAVRTFLK